jgi:hypothetical protein
MFTMSDLFPNLKRIRDLKLNQICLSFDLETPNKAGAGIFSIGITPFSFETGEVFKDCSFYVRMDFEEVLNLSQDVGNTMKWWMSQSVEARNEVISQKTEVVNGRTVVTNLPNCGYEEGLEHSLSYIMQIKDSLITNGTVKVMGNGAIFDIGKYEATLRQFGIIGGIGARYPEQRFMDLCYKFWDIVDLRSYVHMAIMCSGKQPKKLCVREGTHHNAVDDEIYQAQLAIKSAELCGKVYGKA